MNSIAIRAICFAALLIEANRQRRKERRAYYATHREKILKHNAASRARWGHRWKRSPGVYRGRNHLVACVECGQQVFWKQATRLRMRFHKNPAYFCQECAQEDVVQDLDLIWSQYRSQRHKWWQRVVLEREHLFAYAPVPVSEPVSDERLEVIWKVVSELDDRKRIILEYRFKWGMTLAEIGRHFRFSRERVRQIEDRALRLVRRRLPKFFVDDQICSVV